MRAPLNGYQGSKLERKVIINLTPACRPRVLCNEYVSFYFLIYR